MVVCQIEKNVCVVRDGVFGTNLYEGTFAECKAFQTGWHNGRMQLNMIASKRPLPTWADIHNTIAEGYIVPPNGGY